MQSLISKNQASPDEHALLSEKKRLEPAFCIAYQGRLSLNTQGWSSKAKAFYAHAIARTPTALWLHVQRIHLLAELEDAGIYGALVDLFLVLEDKGAPLRQRMLALAKPLLREAEYTLLQEQFKDARQPPLQAKNSMLTPGVSGRLNLVATRQSNQDKHEDELETAQQQLAFGQVELAQQTLEAAIIAEPAREELHHALLEIYRHSRNGDRIQTMWRQLKGTRCPAKAEWHRLIDQFCKDRDTS